MLIIVNIRRECSWGYNFRRSPGCTYYMYRSIEDIRRNAPKLEFWRSYGIDCSDLAVSAVAHRSNSVLLACGRSGVRIPVATDLSRLNT